MNSSKKNEDRKLKVSYVEKVVHQIRSPIGGMINLLEILVNNWSKFDDRSRFQSIQDALTSCRDVNQAIETLDTARLSNISEIIIKPKKTNLKKLIKATISQIQQEFRSKNLDIIFKSGHNRCVAEIDEFWLKQLLSNLLKNAVLYAGDKEIEVSLDILLINGVESACVTVRDHGPGITNDALGLIFEPYIRSNKDKEQVTGAGIGLSIVKEIIVAHRGEITVENHPNGGAEFEVVIPLLSDNIK